VDPFWAVAAAVDDPPSWVSEPGDPPVPKSREKVRGSAPAGLKVKVGLPVAGSTAPATELASAGSAGRPATPGGVADWLLRVPSLPNVSVHELVVPFGAVDVIVHWLVAPAFLVKSTATRCWAPRLSMTWMAVEMAGSVGLAVDDRLPPTVTDEVDTGAITWPTGSRMSPTGELVEMVPPLGLPIQPCTTAPDGSVR